MKALEACWLEDGDASCAWRGGGGGKGRHGGACGGGSGEGAARKLDATVDERDQVSGDAGESVECRRGPDSELRSASELSRRD
jgi:Spy/CpxP family protein refolding chaperone